MFLCNHMVALLAQRGGSFSIVLTENMFSSSDITQLVSTLLGSLHSCSTNPGTRVLVLVNLC